MRFEQVGRIKPDVVVLDIEMPVMDGLTALPKILEASPTSRVLMASTLTRRNASISIKALTLGATDYVPKPESTRDGHASEGFQTELVDKIRAVGQAKKPAKQDAASSLQKRLRSQAGKWMLRPRRLHSSSSLRRKCSRKYWL